VGGCGTFVVLVGRDGVQRWISAETQVALNRYFTPHDDTLRLPIFPILLEGAEAETLLAFLRLFQMTLWNGAADALPEQLLDDIRDRTIVTNKGATFEGCPFVGLAAFRIDQAHLFFGRQKETLDALACFDTRRGSPPVRWLEINGNSGSGKSSLMQAGLLQPFRMAMSGALEVSLPTVVVTRTKTTAAPIPCVSPKRGWPKRGCSPPAIRGESLPALDYQP
jgi:hypothetical protein